MTKSKLRIPVLIFYALIVGIFFVLNFSGLLQPRSHVSAATSSNLNFQARLMTAAGAIVPDGNYNVEFKIYNASSSSGSSQGSCTGDVSCLWTETRTSSNVVRVANGYLTVNLGSVTSFPTTINWDQDLWITMNIGGTSGVPSWDGEMSPRLKLTAVPYAFRAGMLATNNGSFTSTLGFVQPTANRTIQAPDESGTICLQNSSACGFALSSGSGNYIQNGTSLQSGANFNISGTGTAATALQAPLLDAASTTALNIGTTNATAINLNKSTTITGGITQSGGVISLTGNAASSITTSTGGLTLTAAGTSNWTVGGTNQSLTITTSGTGVLTLGTTGAGTVTLGSSSSVINIGATNNARTVHIADGGTSTTQTVIVGSANGSSTTTIQGGTGSSAIALTTATNGKISLTAAGTGGIVGTLGSAGFTYKTTTDSTTALAIQASNNNYIFSVDTTSGIVTMGAIQSTFSGFDGTLNAPFGNITLGGTNTTTIQGNASSTFKATSGSFTTTLGFTTPTANRAINLPDEAGTLCIRNSTNCGFAASSGSANYIQNTTTAQSANMYVQAASSGSVAGVLRANAAGSGDILDLKNGAGTNVATFGSAGAVLLQNSTNSANAFQLQNATGTSLFNIDTTSNGLITAGTALRLNVTSTNADTFTTPLGSSVKTAINIPLYDPGAAGQLLAFGLSSTANATARGISVFDARSAGVIQPAIAVFSPNENDVFGLSWNGLNTIASLETSSAAIALRPGGTNVKLWAGSTGVAIGSNVSSASYPLDVTGDVNTSTQYRIGGTVICTSSGCTPAAGSGNYIQNGTSVQSANMYVQAATSGSVAGVLRANAAGSGDILDLKNGAGTNVATFGSTGAVLLQNSTDSTSAFAINTSSGGTNQNVFRVDTTNERVAVGVISDPIGAKLSVATGSTVGLRVYQGGSSDAIQVGNASADFLKVTSTGAMLLQNTTNSATAFRIQNALGTSNVMVADTSNTRIAIGQATATYTLDVAGDINTSTQLRIAGVSMCDSTGCTAKTGSGYYIHNQTTAQSSNMYVQAATSGSVAAVLQANAAGSGDILDLKDGSGNNVATFGSAGAVTLKNSSNTANAFQVQNASGGQLLNVNTSNSVITLNGGAGGGLTAWTATSSMSTAGSLGGTVIANGFIYDIGGYASGYSAVVRYAPIKANGTIGTWSTTTALPGALGYTSAVTSNGFIYVVGGTNGTANQTSVYYGKQNADGTITAWQTATALPAATNAAAAVVTNGFLYVLGGNVSGSSTTSTYYTHINSDGSLNAFNSGTALPVALANGSSFATNGNIYYLGGINGSGSTVATTYYATLNADGSFGSWTSTTALPSTAANFGAVLMNGNVYMIKSSTTVSYAPINSSGTIGTWVNDSNALPVSYTGMSVATYNGYIYVMGGYNGTTGTTAVYYTSGARTMVAGSLDLVGLTATGNLSNDGSQENGSLGGTLTAGNTTIVGTLQVQSQASFAQNVAINGNNLMVGNDDDDPNTGSTSITVQSRGFAGINLYGDSQNTSGEPGGAYVVYSVDGILNTQAVMGLVQATDVDPAGTAYTGASGNNLLVGTRSGWALQLGTNSNVRMTVMSSGNVCVGVATCTKKFGVSGTIGASGTITASTTPDLAETIAAADDVEAADVVMADPHNTERVVKSDRAYNTAALGVISDGTSSFMINSYAGSSDAPLTGKPLVLAGRVPVKVSGANGSIKPGDYLTSSNIPGYAMKATQAGPTIGKALGYFNGNTGTVLVLVNLGYYNPASDIQGTNNFQNLNVAGDIVVQGGLTVRGATNVGTITIGGHIITQGDAPQPQLLAAAGQGATATVTGNDTAGIIQITLGAQSTADDLLKILFNNSYGGSPRVLLTPVGKDSAQAGGYVDQAAQDSFVLGIVSSAAEGKMLTYNYQIMQ